MIQLHQQTKWKGVSSVAPQTEQSVLFATPYLQLHKDTVSYLRTEVLNQNKQMCVSYSS